MRRERREQKGRQAVEGGGGCGVADDAMAMNGECARECGIMFLLMLSNGHNNCKLPALENLQLPPRHSHIHMHTHTHTHTWTVCAAPKKREICWLFIFVCMGLNAQQQQQRVELSVPANAVY